MGAAAVAVLIRKEREIVDVYRSVGATAPDTARGPDDLGVHRHVAFNRLVARGVLREASGGRYYLDEPTWNALRRLRRRMALVVTAVAILVALVVMFGGVALLGHSVSK